MSRISSDVQNRPDPQHLVCRWRALTRVKRGSSRLTPVPRPLAPLYSPPPVPIHINYCDRHQPNDNQIAIAKGGETAK